LVRFWDSSAILPFLIAERRSSVVRSLFATDSDVLAWWATRVECTSAIERRARTGESTLADADSARQTLRELVRGWQEIDPVEEVRGLAEELLARRSVRAADSLQLAAAIAASRHLPSPLPFVCLDIRLREAAAAEGLTLLPVILT
jgi:predicted nucleic acid-binding protein